MLEMESPEDIQIPQSASLFCFVLGKERGSWFIFQAPESSTDMSPVTQGVGRCRPTSAIGTNSLTLAGATAFKSPPTLQSPPTIPAPPVSKDKLAQQGSERQTRGTQKLQWEERTQKLRTGVPQPFPTKCHVLGDLNKLLQPYFYFIHIGVWPACTSG